MAATFLECKDCKNCEEREKNIMEGMQKLLLDLNESYEAGERLALKRSQHVFNRIIDVYLEMLDKKC